MGGGVALLYHFIPTARIHLQVYPGSCCCYLTLPESPVPIQSTVRELQRWEAEPEQQAAWRKPPLSSTEVPVSSRPDMLARTSPTTNTLPSLAAQSSVPKNPNPSAMTSSSRTSCAVTRPPPPAPCSRSATRWKTALSSGGRTCSTCGTTPSSTR